MVRVSFNQKPFRKTLMSSWGAQVFPSPSTNTEFGRQILEQDPNCPGSLGIAISEALEDTLTHEETRYALGSVLNHVLLHQTVIGLVALKQMELAARNPHPCRLHGRREQLRGAGVPLPWRNEG